MLNSPDQAIRIAPALVLCNLGFAVAGRWIAVPALLIHSAAFGTVLLAIIIFLVDLWREPSGKRKREYPLWTFLFTVGRPTGFWWLWWACAVALIVTFERSDLALLVMASLFLTIVWGYVSWVWPTAETNKAEKDLLTAASPAPRAAGD